MRVIIEQDMEGCAGILDWARDLKASGDMGWATRVVTGEVNAAVEGAVRGGATEALCLEAHPFDYERVHPKMKVVSNDLFNTETGDALFFVGRHAMSGVADGVLNHTGSSKSIREVRINGRPFGELGIVAAWFGNRGVPPAFVSGDEAACREAREFCGNVVTVPVKWGSGCHSAVSLSHPEACCRIQAGAEEAVRRLSEFRPFVVSGPVTWEIEYRHSEIVDWICRIPGLERISATATRYVGKDYESALRMYYAQGAMLWRYDAY
jgi:D-amino peptidase